MDNEIDYRQASVFFHTVAKLVADCIIRCAPAYAAAVGLAACLENGKEDTLKAISAADIANELYAISMQLDATARAIEAKEKSFSEGSAR